MKYKSTELKRVMWVCFLLVPFVIGTVGYSMEGEELWNALYASFALYAINPVADANNWLIMAAKWMGPFVLASGILVALQEIWQRVKDFWIGLHKGATAIYCDNEYGEIVKKNMKRGILVKNETVRDVKEHILFYSDDVKNLEFYQKNRRMLEEKEVYICLNETDSSLLRENSVHFFNTNEIIARTYWHEHHLLVNFDKRQEVIKIAIVGFDVLGKNILNYGLLNNIYDLNQKIEYHIWGDTCLYEHSMQGMQLMNRDCIVYHGENWQTDIQLFAEMNRIIITERLKLSLLQEFIYICTDSEIHYYTPGGAYLENILKKDNLSSFGQYADILTEDNIKKETLYRAAKELNYKYACMYGGASGDVQKKEKEREEQWASLDGFTKGSNIASVDYHEIRKLLENMAERNHTELTMEQLGRMEHIRWCRFHYLNHWTYGIPESGGSKDATRRIHRCLVPFEKLTREDQEKDYEAIKVLQQLMPTKIK